MLALPPTGTVAKTCMRDKVLPARVVGGSSGTKFSLLASNAPKSAFFGVLGEFCTGWAAGLGVLGEFCPGSTREGCEQGEFCTGWAGSATRDECLSACAQCLWLPLIRLGEISHAIPLKIFQVMKSNR